MDVGLKLLNLMGAKGTQTYTKNICPEHETYLLLNLSKFPSFFTVVGYLGPPGTDLYA